MKIISSSEATKLPLKIRFSLQNAVPLKKSLAKIQKTSRFIGLAALKK